MAWKQLQLCRMQNALVTRHIYRRAGVGFFALLIAGTLSQLHAQTTQTVTITSVVPQVLSLGINTNAVTMSFLTTDYNTSTGAATKTVTSANTLSVDSNKNWTVNVKANTAAFAFTPSASDTDPSGEIEFGSMTS